MASELYTDILRKFRSLDLVEQQKLLNELDLLVKKAAEETTGVDPSAQPKNSPTFPSLASFRNSIRLQGEALSETVIKLRQEERY